MSADGKWNVTLNTPLGQQNAEITIKSEGANFTGSAQLQGNTQDIAGSVDGDTLTWKVSITQPMPLTLDFTAKIAGDDMAGSAKAGAFGSFPLTGKRA
ncbi:MAG: hypothetical protein ABW199_08735 [Caulobacterales bacterium]